MELVIISWPISRSKGEESTNQSCLERLHCEALRRGYRRYIFDSVVDCGVNTSQISTAVSTGLIRVTRPNKLDKESPIDEHGAHILGRCESRRRVTRHKISI